MPFRRGRGEEQPAAAPTSVPADAPVVVVADDADGCELLVRILATAPSGWPLRRCRDLLELTERLVRGPAAAVVVDVTSGVGAGLKIVDTIRNSNDPSVASTPVVLVIPTAHTAMFSWQAGVDEVLVRPFHARDLVGAVTAAIARPHEERQTYRRQQLELAKRHRRSGGGQTVSS